jgi:hypothetical protein
MGTGPDLGYPVVGFHSHETDHTTHTRAQILGTASPRCGPAAVVATSPHPLSSLFGVAIRSGRRSAHRI